MNTYNILGYVILGMYAIGTVALFMFLFRINKLKKYKVSHINIAFILYLLTVALFYCVIDYLVNYI